MKPKTPAQRLAKTRSARRNAGLCISCGSPPLVRVIVAPDGREIERRPLTQCERCRARAAVV